MKKNPATPTPIAQVKTSVGAVKSARVLAHVVSRTQIALLLLSVWPMGCAGSKKDSDTRAVEHVARSEPICAAPDVEAPAHRVVAGDSIIASHPLWGRSVVGLRTPGLKQVWTADYPRERRLDSAGSVAMTEDAILFDIRAGRLVAAMSDRLLEVDVSTGEVLREFLGPVEVEQEQRRFEYGGVSFYQDRAGVHADDGRMWPGATLMACGTDVLFLRSESNVLRQIDKSGSLSPAVGRWEEVVEGWTFWTGESFERLRYAEGEVRSLDSSACFRVPERPTQVVSTRHGVGFVAGGGADSSGPEMFDDSSLFFFSFDNARDGIGFCRSGAHHPVAQAAPSDF